MVMQIFLSPMPSFGVQWVFDIVSSHVSEAHKSPGQDQTRWEPLLSLERQVLLSPDFF